jgi:hypothetical protein
LFVLVGRRTDTAWYCTVPVHGHQQKSDSAIHPEFAAMEISRGVLTPTLGLVQDCYFPHAALPFQHTRPTRAQKQNSSVIGGVLVTYGIPKGFYTSVSGNNQGG